MFWKIVLNENTKIVRRKLFWVELILMALIVLGILGALYIAVEMNQDGSGLLSGERSMFLETLTWPEALNNVIGMAGWDGFGLLFLIVLVGAVTGQEYSWRTYHLPLSRGVSRTRLVIAKLSALFLAGLGFVLTVLLTGAIATAIFSVVINGSLHLEQLEFTQLLFSTLRAIFTMLPYGCLTFFLAVASRSTVVAISGGLAYTLFLENLFMQAGGLLGETISNILLYLPGGLANSLIALNNISLGDVGISVITEVPPLHAAIGIGGWTLLFLSLSLWVFQRQDLIA